MKMKYFIILCLLFCLYSSRTNATNLRGQLVRNVNGTYLPLPGVRVELMIFDGREWVLFSYAITGNDGFYFFMNFRPGITFCVRVFGYYYPPQPMVSADVYYQDIPPIAT